MTVRTIFRDPAGGDWHGAIAGSEWDLNPDTTMVAAGGTVVLQPKVTSGTATVTLGTPQADSGITVAVSQPTLSKGHNGKITVTAGSTPGFYHYSVPSTDTTGVAQTAEWIHSRRQSSRIVDQDRRQPERCGGKPIESFSDASIPASRVAAPPVGQFFSLPAPVRSPVAWSRPIPPGRRRSC